MSYDKQALHLRLEIKSHGQETSWEEQKPNSANHGAHSMKKLIRGRGTDTRYVRGLAYY